MYNVGRYWIIQPENNMNTKNLPIPHHTTLYDDDDDGTFVYSICNAWDNGEKFDNKFKINVNIAKKKSLPNMWGVT